MKNGHEMLPRQEATIDEFVVTEQSLEYLLPRPPIRARSPMVENTQTAVQIAGSRSVIQLKQRADSFRRT